MTLKQFYSRLRRTRGKYRWAISPADGAIRGTAPRAGHDPEAMRYVCPVTAVANNSKSSCNFHPNDVIAAGNAIGLKIGVIGYLAGAADTYWDGQYSESRCRRYRAEMLKALDLD